MDDYLSQLNQQQRAAVEHLDSPSLVIAGAGSGKTRVLTYKIIHLLAKGYKPSRILALTFTNKAANEMKRRIADLMGTELASRIWAGTFHSMFLRILQQNSEKIGYKGRFTIYDTSDSKALVKSIVKELGLDDKVYVAQSVLNAISMAKNALISPEDYAMNKDLLELDRRSKRPMIHTIYTIYRNRARASNVMDFDDILFYTYTLLRDNPDLLNHYKEFFQYVLVDEYQDTNYAQHCIINLLTANQNNLMVVGDDAQSIYSFRGANISNILNLKKNYPGLTIFKLERNYRSTRNIIKAANSLIAKNLNQIPKEIFSENEDGKPIEILKSYSDYEEGYLVANKITRIQQTEHDTFNSFAILYRTNAQSRVLEESLRKRNIPYRIYGGMSFYQRKEVKDAIAYFRLALNPEDDEALRRVINYPARGIGETTLSKLFHASAEKGVSIWQILQPENIAHINVNAGTRGKLENFRNMIQDFVARNQDGTDAFSLAKHIVDRTRLLAVLLTDTAPESISKQENLNELINGVRSFVVQKTEENGETGIGMADFLNEVSLASDLDKEEEPGKEAVTLMTVHAAKGLEFKHVIIVGAEEDLFPSALSKSSPTELEEERRLMYVAVTRAMKTCIISYAQQRFRNGQTIFSRPSRFIAELDQNLLKINGTPYKPATATAQPIDRFAERYRSTAQIHVPETSNQSTRRTVIIGNNRANAAHTAGSATDEYVILTLSRLKVGDKVEHQRFGVGVVEKTEVIEDNERVTVTFTQTGTKTLMLRFAKLKIIDHD